jgi:hypothetical protein
MSNKIIIYSSYNDITNESKIKWSTNYLCLNNEVRLKCLNDIITNLQHEISIISHIQEVS